MRVPVLLGTATAVTAALTLSVSSPAFAAKTGGINQNVTQTSTNNTVTGYGNINMLTGSAAGNALQNASGNIGFNAAGGDGNQQANVAYIDTGSPPFDVAVTLKQTSGGNTVTSGADEVRQASFDGNAFQYASGNIGANAAAGYLNQQINALVVLDANDFATNATTITQNAGNSGNGGNTYTTDANTSTSAYAQGNAFGAASGHIGVNAASGAGNMQINQLTLASNKGQTVSGSPSALPQTINQTNDNNQVNSVAGPAGFAPDMNNAYAAGSAFNSASGDIGFNAAAGSANEQANSAFIDQNTVPQFAFTGTYNQTSLNNSISRPGLGSYNTNNAYVAGNAFQYASGNIGVNAAAGAVNDQMNAAIILNPDELSSSTTNITQKAMGNTGTSFDTNNAYVAGNAFQTASGNIGVNLAAGNGNMQVNQLILLSH